MYGQLPWNCKIDVFQAVFTTAGSRKRRLNMNDPPPCVRSCCFPHRMKDQKLVLLSFFLTFLVLYSWTIFLLISPVYTLNHQFKSACIFNYVSVIKIWIGCIRSSATKLKFGLRLQKYGSEKWVWRGYLVPLCRVKRIISFYHFSFFSIIFISGVNRSSHNFCFTFSSF